MSESHWRYQVYTPRRCHGDHITGPALPNSAMVPNHAKPYPSPRAPSQQGGYGAHACSNACCLRVSRRPSPFR